MLDLGKANIKKNSHKNIIPTFHEFLEKRAESNGVITRDPNEEGGFRRKFKFTWRMSKREREEMVCAKALRFKD